MVNRTLITRTVLWLFVVFAGIHVGAALYEVFVIIPLWAGAPPESVTGWNLAPQYAIRPEIYWMKFSPVYQLLSLAVFIVSWLMPTPRRKWALAAGTCGLIVSLATIFFFVPILLKTIYSRGAGLSGAEITALVNQWVGWNWLRLALMLVGWLAAIRALNMVSATDVKSPRAS
jgi:Domain of unknown function (DUF1772)